MVVGRLPSYWEGNFSGPMLSFQGVIWHNPQQCNVSINKPLYVTNSEFVVVVGGLQTVQRIQRHICPAKEKAITFQ